MAALAVVLTDARQSASGNGNEMWGATVNRAGFVIHSAIHASVPEAHCVMHTHTTTGSAVACLKDGLSPDNFYGAMLDTINGDDDSDRLLVRWRLRDPAVVAACAGSSAPAVFSDELARGAVVALGIDRHGAPEPGRLDAATSLVAVPPNIEALRGTDPALAQEWRAAVRGALAALVADGARICVFDRAGWYVVRRSS